jgi:hypothetical protein
MNDDHGKRVAEMALMTATLASVVADWEARGMTDVAIGNALMTAAAAKLRNHPAVEVSTRDQIAVLAEALLEHQGITQQVVGGELIAAGTGLLLQVAGVAGAVRFLDAMIKQVADWSPPHVNPHGPGA